MEHLLTNKTVSLTEMRDPAKVLAEAGDTPVAVLNRNNVVGYFVPKAAVDALSFDAADHEKVIALLKEHEARHKPVQDYLKDK